MNKEPLVVERISNFDEQTGYIYRFGTGVTSRLVEWRAGDYSGYTLPNRYPVENELSILTEDLKDNIWTDTFAAYTLENNIDGHSIADDPRSRMPICKVFPEEEAPLPYELSEDPKYKNLLSLYSPSYRNKNQDQGVYEDDVSINSNKGNLLSLGNLCSYEKVTAASYDTYLPIGAFGDSVTSFKSLCSRPADRQGYYCNIDVDYGSNWCDPDEEVNPRVPSCAAIEKVKTFYGLQSMCLEYDILSPIYGDVYSDILKIVDNTFTGADYQPYACLSYYPFQLDMCVLYNYVPSGYGGEDVQELLCLSDSACEWNGDECFNPVE